MAITLPLSNPEVVTASGGLQQKKRQLEMLEGMLAQMISPTIPAGRVHVANWGDAIGRIAEAYGANRLRKEVASEEATLADRLQQITKSELAKYMLARDGRPEEWSVDGMGPPRPEVKGDRMAALVGAMTSGIPAVGEFAQKDYDNWQKGQLTPQDLIKTPGASVASRVAAATQGSPAPLVADPQIVTADGVAAALDPSGKVLGREAIAPYNSPITGPGGVPGQENAVTGKFGGITGGNVTPIDTRLQLAGADADLKRISEGQEPYQKGIKSMAELTRAEQLAMNIDPGKLGPLSDFRQFLSVLPQLWGGQLDPGSQQYQVLASALGQNLVDIIRAFAPVSNVDAQRALQIAGSTGNTRDALVSIIAAARENKARELGKYEDFVTSVSTQYPQFGGEAFRKRWVTEKWPNPDDYPKGAAGPTPVGVPAASTPASKNRKPLSAY